MPSENPRGVCFLVGAGCSPAYPLATHVTEPLLRLILGRNPEENEKNIRFEFLMQVIKDCLDPSLNFLSAIYGPSCSEKLVNSHGLHPYAYLFASIINNSKNSVFTTNFDTTIERADSRTVSIFRDADFNAYLDKPREGLLNLHGSVDDPETLAATYDSVGIKDDGNNDAKFRALLNALREKDLCVVGYSGYDDMDVVPTLLAADASDRELHWFHYSPNRPVGTCSASELFNDPDAIDPNIARKPIFNILQNLVRSGRRSPAKITIHYGSTEQALLNFCRSRCFDSEIISKAELLANNYIKSIPKRSFLERSKQAKDVIDLWFETLPIHSKTLLNAAAAEIVYQQHADNTIFSALKLKIQSDLAILRKQKSANSAAIQIVIIARVVPLYYWFEEYDEVENFFTESKILLESLVDGQMTRHLASVAPRLVATSHFDVCLWWAETCRMKGEYDKAETVLNDCKELFQPEIICTNLRDSGAFIESLKLSTNSVTRYDRAYGWCQANLADLEYSRENFSIAEKYFYDAYKLLSRSGNSYWRLYCEIKRTNCQLYQGRINAARSNFEQIKAGNVFSGWTEWMDAHPDLQLANIERLQMGSDKFSISTEATLKKLTEYLEDPQFPKIAELLLWSLNPRNFANCSAEKLHDELKEIDIFNWIGLDRLSVEILYIEALMNANHLREADQKARNLILHDAPQSSKLVRLRGHILLQEIQRRQGENVTSQLCELIQFCKLNNYELELAYLLAIATASGAKVDQDLRLRAVNWVTENRINWLADLLNASASEPGGLVPVRFPFVYTDSPVSLS